MSVRIIHRCRVCKCTDDRACAGGCYWVVVESSSRPLCSTCAGTIGDVAEVLVRVAGEPRARRRATLSIAAIKRCKQRAQHLRAPQRRTRR